MLQPKKRASANRFLVLTARARGPLPGGGLPLVLTVFATGFGLVALVLVTVTLLTR